MLFFFTRCEETAFINILLAEEKAVSERGFLFKESRFYLFIYFLLVLICCRSPSLVVADFGCGDCKIARSVKNKVHSFDLAAACDLVTVCDMAKVSRPPAVYVLSVFSV